jgi:glycerate dehydrogenase
VERLANATIAVLNKVSLRKTDLERLPKLKMIAIAATGYDVVDIQQCRAQGIAVANIRNYAVNTVPEHAFAMILALRRNLVAYQRSVQSGRWQQADQFCYFDYPIGDLAGATLGIVGEGAIGQATARIARGFNMKVLFADHAPPKAADIEYTSLQKLLEVSDVISLHCPLTPQTQGLIGEPELRSMKKNALLINTSRGGLVDELALAHALRQDWIAGAGFDVLSSEPPRHGNPLLDADVPNFILTPHVAWASDQAMQKLADQLIDNVEAWQQERPQNLVA